MCYFAQLGLEFDRAGDYIGIWTAGRLFSWILYDDDVKIQDWLQYKYPYSRYVYFLHLLLLHLVWLHAKSLTLWHCIQVTSLSFGRSAVWLHKALIDQNAD